MGIKFLQTSDWHLGTKMVSFPKDVADSWRTQAASSLNSIIKSAIEEDVQLIFLPGDLFDNVRPSEKIKAVLRGILRQIPETVKVFVNPGTHDYYVSNGLWDDPDFSKINVFRSGGFSSIYLQDLNTEVWGVPVLKGNRDENWLANPPELNPERMNILLYHGDYRGTGREYDKWDFPFELSHLENAGFDYVALGHHHKAKFIKSTDRTLAGYSGSPVGWSYRKSELSDRYFVTGEVSKQVVRVELRTVECNRIYNYTVNLSNPVETGDILEEIDDLKSGDILRLMVSGKDYSGFRLRIDEISKNFRFIEFIEVDGEDDRINPSDNYHLKYLIEKLEENWKKGDIDEDFYKRLVDRALRVFS